MSFLNKLFKSDTIITPTATPQPVQEPLTLDQFVLNEQKGFAVYRGEDLLKLKDLSGYVNSIKEALGGDESIFKQHIYPSMRVFAAYAQFLPAAGKDTVNGHHKEFLGLLTHSLQTALVALNLARNVNFTFGKDPNKRSAVTSMYYVTSCLAALLHDVGKINDFKIQTTRKMRDGKTRTYDYVFINSIPEFLAEAHELDINKDVYINPWDNSADNRIRTSHLPLYEILGMFPGRGKTHEIMSSEKKHLFVSINTEKLIAKTSRDMYEEFNYYAYQGQLASSVSTNNILYKLVNKADTISARYWLQRHSKDTISQEDVDKFNSYLKEPLYKDEEIDHLNNIFNGDDCTAVVPPNSSAQQANSPAEETEAETEEETWEGENRNSTSVEPPVPTAKSESAKAAQKTPAPVKDVQEPESAVHAVGRMTDTEYRSVSTSSEARKALIDAMQNAIKATTIFIDKPKGLLFPFGYNDMSGQRKLKFFLRYDSKSKVFLNDWFKQANSLSGHDILEEAGFEKRDLSSMLKVLLANDLVIPANSDNKLYQIMPMCMWSPEFIENGLFDAVLIKDLNILFDKESDILGFNEDSYKKRNVWFKDNSELCIDIDPEWFKRAGNPYVRNREFREQVLDGSFKPDFGEKKPEIIKTEGPKLSETETEEPDDATPDIDFDNLTEEQKKELLESAIEETDKPDVPDLSELTATAPETATVFDSSTQDMLNLLGNIIPEAKASEEASTRSSESEDTGTDPQESTELADTENHTDDNREYTGDIGEIKKPDVSAGLDPLTQFLNGTPAANVSEASEKAGEELIKARSASEVVAAYSYDKEPVIIGRFSEDIKDDEIIEYIKQLQHSYWCSKRIYQELRAKSPAVKEKLRNALLEHLKKRIQDDEIYESTVRELSLAKEHKSSRFSLVTHDNELCYAAFMWDRKHRRDNNAKTFKEKLKKKNLFPLAPIDDERRPNMNKDNTWYELHYFGCMMLTSVITRIMALDGIGWEKIEASRTLYHERERPPKAWDIVRLFQLRILTVEDNGMFMDKYRVDGNSNYIRTVDEDAIFDFQEQEMIRLRLPKGMKPPMSKKTFNNLVQISKQDVPPFIWKVRGSSGIRRLKISFFPPKEILESGMQSEDTEEETAD